MRVSQVQTFSAPYREVAATTTPTELFPEAGPMSAILGRTIWNDSTATINVRLGPVEDLVAGKFNVQLAAGGYYEVPYGYIGAIAGVWSSATGIARLSDIQ